MTRSAQSDTDDRAVRAIADTSRYDGSTEDRELDARVALDAVRGDGLVVVRAAEFERLRQALRVLADRTNWTAHGLDALAMNPLIYGHFDPIELASRALDQKQAER